MYVARPDTTVADLIAQNPESEEVIRSAHDLGYQRAMWHHRNKPKPVDVIGDRETAECALIMEYSKSISVDWTDREKAETIALNAASAPHIDVSIVDVPADGEELDLPSYADLESDESYLEFQSYLAWMDNDDDKADSPSVMAHLRTGVELSAVKGTPTVTIPVSQLPGMISHLEHIYDMYIRNL